MVEQHHDGLNRPVAGVDKDDVPLASDILVASASRRLFAFIIDVVLVLLLSSYMMLPIIERFVIFVEYNENSLAFVRALVMSSFMTWCAYVVSFNASSLRATIGQYVMGIYVCTVFGHAVSMAIAAGRFLIFSAPIVILVAGGLEELMTILPVIQHSPMLKAGNVEVSEYFYPIVLAVLLIQFIMIWPLLTGNYSRVMWDYLFHTSVLRKKARVF